MLRNIADLLSAFAKEEARKLDALGIKHAPTIGEMYERLTDKILSRSLPTGLDLQIANGFITNRDNFEPTTGQIDCMLVRGEGKQIGDLDRHIWHIRDVIAVLEVKKNLYTADLEDAFDQLRGVADTYDHWVQSRPQHLRDIQSACHAFADISGEIAPERDRLSELPPHLQMLFHSLVVEQDAPIRIALGYDGYSSEYGLRRGYLKFVEGKKNEIGFGVRSIPNLIVAGGSCLVKQNGQPYWAKMQEGWWPVLASGAGNPIRFLLELIWTRLLREEPDFSHAWFGDDLTVEILVRFIDAKLALDASGDPVGWHFRHTDLKGKDLKVRATEAAWEPEVLTEAQYAVYLRILRENVDTTARDFVAFANAHGGAAEMAASLVSTGLVARDREWLIPTTELAQTAFLPDGRIVAGENSTGRFERWLSRYLDHSKRSAPT